MVLFDFAWVEFWGGYYLFVSFRFVFCSCVFFRVACCGLGWDGKGVAGCHPVAQTNVSSSPPLLSQAGAFFEVCREYISLILRTSFFSRLAFQSMRPPDNSLVAPAAFKLPARGSWACVGCPCCAAFRV